MVRLLCLQALATAVIPAPQKADLRHKLEGHIKRLMGWQRQVTLMSLCGDAQICYKASPSKSQIPSGMHAPTHEWEREVPG